MAKFLIMSDERLFERAAEVYARLGGIGNADARIVRALSERLQAANKEIERVAQVAKNMYLEVVEAGGVNPTLLTHEETVKAVRAKVYR
jgi:hypothetical protein